MTLGNLLSSILQSSSLHSPYMCTWPAPAMIICSCSDLSCSEAVKPSLLGLGMVTIMRPRAWSHGDVGVLLQGCAVRKLTACMRLATDAHVSPQKGRQNACFYAVVVTAPSQLSILLCKSFLDCRAMKPQYALGIFTMIDNCSC